MDGAGERRHVGLQRHGCNRRASAWTARPIFLDARVPVSDERRRKLQLRGLGGDDTFTVEPQAGIDILVEGDGPSGSDTLNYAADNSGGDPGRDCRTRFGPGRRSVPADDRAGRLRRGDAHRASRPANLDIAGGDLYVAGTRGEDVITFTPLSEDSGTADRRADPDDLQHRRCAGRQAAGDHRWWHGTGGPTGGGFADKVVYKGTNGRDLIRVDAPNREVSLDVLGFSSTDVHGEPITLDDGTAALRHARHHRSGGSQCPRRQRHDSSWLPLPLSGTACSSRSMADRRWPAMRW